MKSTNAFMLILYASIGLNAGCAHTIAARSEPAIVGERTVARSDPANSLLIVLERKNYSIERRPEGGFYENGIVAQQLKLEQELKTNLVEYLQQRGISSEFMSIPATLGPTTEGMLSWNSAIGKDRFPYLLAIVPGNGTLQCRFGGYDCSAAFALEVRVTRRSDNLLLWKGTIKSVGPSMLASAADAPSILVRDLTAKLIEDGVIKTQRSPTAIAQERRVAIKPDLEFASRLNELSKQNDVPALLRMANNPQNKEQLMAALDWMRSRAFYSDERDPRYLFSYADLLNQAKVRDTAILAYLTGMLVSRVEATRCKEKSGARVTIEELQTKWKSFDDGYWSLPENNRKTVLDQALGFESLKAKGNPIPWLCPGGLQEMGIALKEAISGAPRITAVKEPGKPEKIFVDTSGIAPAFLTYEQSLPERKRVIEEFKNHYAQSTRPN